MTIPDPLPPGTEVASNRTFTRDVRLGGCLFHIRVNVGDYGDVVKQHDTEPMVYVTWHNVKAAILEVDWGLWTPREYLMVARLPDENRPDAKNISYKREG